MSGKSLSEQFDDYDSTCEWLALYNKIRNDSSKLHANLKCKHSRLIENVKLNRYRDVLPYDHSRVILSSGSYINASHVPVSRAGRSYILTQGPLPDTAEHFWEMVWQEKSKAVIMLNRVMEKNQVKCHQYFPERGDKSENGKQPTLTFGNYELRLLNETESKHYCLRNLLLICKQNENNEKNSNDERKILHYQFNTWPDFGVPETTHDFLEFLYEVRKTNVLNNRLYGPPVIHCSAGIGRSGTFIIVDAVLVIAHNNVKNQSQIDIVKMVTELRYFRMGLIQTPDQLRFCWKAIVDALNNDEWKDLLETTCCDAEPEMAALIYDDDVDENGRPYFKRLSANHTTDSNCSSCEDETDDESSSGDEKSSTLKRRRHRSSNSKRRGNNNEQQSLTNDDDAHAGDGFKHRTPNGVRPKRQSSVEQDDDDARSSYMARLRKRQERAKEMQAKIERIQAKLRQTNGWEKYKNWAFGGAAVLVGGLFVYLYFKLL